METSPAGRTAVVDRMSQAPEGEFFRLLKDSTIRVYYTSKIGIHQEMEYKGNVLLNEFIGIEPK
jgi:Gluconate 2-dehydrogenase subunit 3